MSQPWEGIKASMTNSILIPLQNLLFPFCWLNLGSWEGYPNPYPPPLGCYF